MNNKKEILEKGEKQENTKAKIKMKDDDNGKLDNERC